ncbi:MAG TPA: threonylcarbamoyl-AMP synthase [Flavobacteriales bacterium]|nr:threonylcarbamoyl-AMP synthase [Crocinitomicaceae bacterium]HAE32006.1 threonylcarbamoyl-AMP synthase [Flavobacteriales bacterium]|tara:strand:+ start:436 stop:1056 length:621 start_codon:yes stop_codon:yes gene_type:complete
MLIEIHPDNPEPRKITEVVNCLRKGGVIIYPTDTIYSIGCDLRNKKAIEKVARLKGVRLRKAQFSLICYDLSSIGDYTKQFDRSVFKAMNKALPGPYTFILNAGNKVPKLFETNKKEVGIRIPDNNIARQVVHELGNPIIATSVHDDDEILEYTTDPSLIHEKYENMVDLVIDGGYGKNNPSTIVDCTDGEINVIREGIGSIDVLT